MLLASGTRPTHRFFPSVELCRSLGTKAASKKHINHFKVQVNTLESLYSKLKKIEKSRTCFSIASHSAPVQPLPIFQQLQKKIPKIPFPSSTTKLDSCPRTSSNLFHATSIPVNPLKACAVARRIPHHSNSKTKFETSYASRGKPADIVPPLKRPHILP